jgi:DNA/RNA endonuclease YhcR with UshA esterase domain
MVKIRGVVSNVIDAESVAILEVTQPQEITVVMFKDGESIELDKGNEIEVIGRVDEYQGELEIIAERIRIIR